MIRKLFKAIRLGESAFNDEFTSIYNEYRPGFLATMQRHYSYLRREDLEEAFDDAMLVFYKDVKEGRLDDSRGSLQTYIYKVGAYKAVDIIRRKHPDRYIGTSIEELDTFANLTVEDSDPFDQDKHTLVTDLVHRLEEPCRKILFLFYWSHCSMSDIAEELGYANANVAKTKKNTCMNKVKAVARCDFELKGLI
ncbi:MAG: sigma-70 family RNA polymerase sigma factor [Prevotella sp.]|nr:sigma-70 family RNA polymerase sigma factor [Prevotella sp.]